MKRNERFRAIALPTPRRKALIWPLFGNFLEIFWIFLSHSVTPCAAASYEHSLSQYIRLFGPCQEIFWDFLGYFVARELLCGTLFHRFN
jgi:hypothetical protein